jgi:hypothetical protein
MNNGNNKNKLLSNYALRREHATTTNVATIREDHLSHFCTMVVVALVIFVHKILPNNESSKENKILKESQ